MLPLRAAAEKIIVQITAEFKEREESLVYVGQFVDAVEQHSKRETKRMLTQPTQITFMSAANCEGLKVTHRRVKRGRGGPL